MSAEGCSRIDTGRRGFLAELARCQTPWGRAGDLGIGIRMGMGVGSTVLRMHHGFVVTPMYPPESILKGIAVNARGQRFCAEDAYYGVIGHKIAYKQGGRAWMVVDQASAYGWKDFRLPVAAQGESIETIEHQLGMPAGALMQTVAYYNRHAANGTDPLLHKAAEFVAPLRQAPFSRPRTARYSAARCRRIRQSWSSGPGGTAPYNAA